MTSVSEVDWQMAPEEIEVAPQRQRVGQVAVVGDREAAGVEVGEQRLHVAQDGVAGGGVAVVAERDVALEAADHVGLVEVVADEAEAALGMEVAAVEGDDAGGLLAAMLQGVKAERGQGRGILVAENTEDAALLAQAIVLVSRQGSGIGTLFDRNLHAGLAKSAVQHQAPPSRSGTRVRGAPWI